MVRAVSSFAAAVLLIAVAVALPAQAQPMFFDGPGGIGISATTRDMLGLQVITGATAKLPAGLIDIRPPGPQAIPSVPGPGTPANPVDVATLWDIDVIGATDLLDTFLLFIGPQTYNAENVGFEVDESWVIFELGDETPVWIPAVPLGDLLADGVTPDVDATLPLVHLIGEEFSTQGTNPIEVILPQYANWIVFTPGEVPEPAGLPLVALLLGAWAARRAQRRVS